LVGAGVESKAELPVAGLVAILDEGEVAAVGG